LTPREIEAKAAKPPVKATSALPPRKIAKLFSTQEKMREEVTQHIKRRAKFWARAERNLNRAEHRAKQRRREHDDKRRERAVGGEARERIPTASRTARSRRTAHGRRHVRAAVRNGVLQDADFSRAAVDSVTETERQSIVQPGNQPGVPAQPSATYMTLCLKAALIMKVRACSDIATLSMVLIHGMKTFDYGFPPDFDHDFHNNDINSHRRNIEIFVCECTHTNYDDLEVILEMLDLPSAPAQPSVPAQPSAAYMTFNDFKDHLIVKVRDCSYITTLCKTLMHAMNTFGYQFKSGFNHDIHHNDIDYYQRNINHIIVNCSDKDCDDLAEISEMLENSLI